MNDCPERWLAEIAEGSAAAFSRFYDTFAPMVYRLARQVSRNANDAEDVCQDVFLEVLHRADSYDPARGSVEAWLAVRTRSRALDRLRKQASRPTVEWNEEDAPPAVWWRTGQTAEYEALRRVELEEVKQALRSIPPMQRMAVYGSYVERLSHRELAAMLKRPIGTVKSLIRYGLRNLRQRLDEMNGARAVGGDGRHE